MFSFLLAQDDNDLDSGEIEVKIETEDGFEEQLALLDESLSPAEFLQHPDDDGTMLENEEEDGEDGDFEFIINPQKDTSTLRWVRKEFQKLNNSLFYSQRNISIVCQFL